MEEEKGRRKAVPSTGTGLLPILWYLTNHYHLALGSDKDNGIPIPKSGHRFPGLGSKLTLQSIFSLPKGHGLLAGDLQ